MSVKLLCFGDLHRRGTNPRNRTDDYRAASNAELREIYQIAKDEKVDAIVNPGDFFDSPTVAYGVLNEAADLLEESPVPWYITPGNHDIPGYNLSAYKNTAMQVLARMIPSKFNVLMGPSIPVPFETMGVKVQLTFTPFSGEMDRNGYGYSPEVDLGPEFVKIHVAHGMLLDHVPPFDRYSLVQEVQTTADLVFTGHDHTGFGVYHRHDNKTFVNLGSLARLAASVAEIERTIQAFIIQVNPGAKNKGIIQPLKIFNIVAAKPGVNVLDRRRIEESNKRAYAMETFSALLKVGTGDGVRVDITTIMEEIAKQEDIDPEVVALALGKIEAARLRIA